MLAHAFASGARGVELLTDLRNAWSQAAFAKLGAIREGVLRRDRKTWTGHIRDNVVLSIKDLDWPKISQRPDMRLEGQTRGLLPRCVVLGIALWVTYLREPVSSILLCNGLVF